MKTLMRMINDGEVYWPPEWQPASDDAAATLHGGASETP